MRRVLVLLLFPPLLGCGKDFSCRTGAMRCSGDRVKMCNADHNWVDWLDCGEEGMTCYSDRTHCGGSGDIACCD